MRKILFIALLVFSYTLGAVPVRQKPVVRIQPNGDTIHLFVTGDEYYHRLNDVENYTIIQHPQTGYWVYADKEFISSDRWNVVATDYVVGKVNLLPPSSGVYLLQIEGLPAKKVVVM